jgi:hypothetical protein
MKRVAFLILMLMVLIPANARGDFQVVAPALDDEWYLGETYTITLFSQFSVLMSKSQKITLACAQGPGHRLLAARHGPDEPPLWETCGPLHLCREWTIEPVQLPCGLGRYRIEVKMNTHQVASEPFTIKTKPPQAPDLTITGFHGTVLEPGVKDVSGHGSDSRRLQLHWTVRNQTGKPSGETVLRVWCEARGSAPCPWPGDHRDFTVPALNAQAGKESHEVYAVFPVGAGSLMYRFTATVNPDQTFAETNFYNNTRRSSFPLAIDRGAMIHLPSSGGVVEKAIKAMKFDVLSPKENHTYYHPEQIRVIMPVTTRKIHLRIGKKDPDTNTLDTVWMLWSVEKEDFIDKGGYFLWQKSLALPPAKYYFIARPHSIEHVALGPAASDKDGIQFRVAPLSEKLHVAPEAAERILRPHIVVHRLSQSPPWHPGENHSVRWSRTGFKVPGKVRIFLVRGKGMASQSSANRYEWSPPGGVANTGYWRRNLPRNLPPHEHYRILIESVDNPEISGLSEFFPIRMRMHAGPLTPKGHALTLHPPASAQVAAQPGVKPGKKPGAAVKKLLLKSPHGMETFHIGETCLISWQSMGVKGNIRIILENRNGTKRTLNGMVGTPVSRKSFPWKIGADIKPGSMYRIYLRSVDGKVTSCKSGGFNIHRIDPDKAKKMLRKTNKPKRKKPPRGGHIQLH